MYALEGIDGFRVQGGIIFDWQYLSGSKGYGLCTGCAAACPRDHSTLKAGCSCKQPHRFVTGSHPVAPKVEPGILVVVAHLPENGQPAGCARFRTEETCPVFWLFCTSPYIIVHHIALARGTRQTQGPKRKDPALEGILVKKAGLDTSVDDVTCEHAQTDKPRRGRNHPGMPDTVESPTARPTPGGAGCVHPLLLVGRTPDTSRRLQGPARPPPYCRWAVTVCTIRLCASSLTDPSGGQVREDRPGIVGKQGQAR